MKSNKVKLRGRLRKSLYWPMFMTILLICMNVVIYMDDILSGVMFSIFTAIYFVVSLIVYVRNKPVLVNELINFATQYGTVQRQLLNEFEIPYALLDYNAKILWVNEQFTELTGKDKKYHKSITTIFPSLTKEFLQKNEGSESVSLKLKDQDFRVSLKRIYFEELNSVDSLVTLDESNEYLTAVYLFDETEKNRYMRENQEQKMVAGLVYIDNYDEALDSIEDVKRSLLVALIDRKVNKYFTELDALVRKIEKDKYFVVLKYQYLAKLREDRFSLIEDVKTVKVGNEMAVTLSIGIGLDGLVYAQNYEFARTAIDFALGRGGDQAVIKTPESITYYGGKSQQVEKNTRVKARVKAHALREIITGKDRVIVMGHRMPDVDSFGSAVGIYRIAQTLGRKAHIVLNEATTSVQPLVELFKNNPEYDEDMIITSQQAIDMAGSNTVLVVVDVNKPSITECPDLLRFCKSVVVLDHHRQGTETIENATLSYVEPYASSACEMVSEILQYTYDNIKIRTEEADCMYSGIMIDTNNFMTKTGVRTFEAAAFLRRNGADVTRVRKLFREDAAEYKAKADAVSQAEIYKQFFAISLCTAEDLPSPTIIGAQAANELLNIKGIKASFVLTDYQGKIYVSARSIDEVNVQIIMERMGGGGHMNTAACQMEGVGLVEAIGVLKHTIDDMLESGEI